MEIPYLDKRTSEKPVSTAATRVFPYPSIRRENNKWVNSTLDKTKQHRIQTVEAAKVRLEISHFQHNSKQIKYGYVERKKLHSNFDAKQWLPGIIIQWMCHFHPDEFLCLRLMF